MALRILYFMVKWSKRWVAFRRMPLRGYFPERAGPAATIGEVLSIDFAKPRDRTSMMNDPLYYQCLDHLVSFLTERAHLRTEPRIHDSSSLLSFTGKKVEQSSYRNHAVA